MKFIQDGIQWLFDGLLSGFNFLFGIVESFYKAYTAVTIIFLGVLWFGLMYATDCLISTWMIAVTIRAIKAWIPTLT